MAPGVPSQQLLGPPAVLPTQEPLYSPSRPGHLCQSALELPGSLSSCLSLWCPLYSSCSSHCLCPSRGRVHHVQGASLSIPATHHLIAPAHIHAGCCPSPTCMPGLRLRTSITGRCPTGDAAPLGKAKARLDSQEDDAQPYAVPSAQGCPLLRAQATDGRPGCAVPSTLSRGTKPSAGTP